MPSLFDEIAARADREPDALALITEEDGHRTYGQLAERSAALAAGLGAALGLRPTERICLWMVNQPAWVEACLAAAAGRFASVAANPEWSDGEIAFILEHSESSAVICDAALAERAAAIAKTIPNVRHVIGIDAGGRPSPPGTIGYEALLAQAPVDPRRAVPGGPLDPPAFIMYTSGTTAGRPKAVVGHLLPAGSGADYQEMFGLAASDRGMVVTPFFHGNGVGGLLAALQHGASLVFPRRFSARRFWPLVDLYRPTYLWTLSSIVNILMGRPGGAHERRHSMRVAIVLGAAGGAPLIEERFGVPVIDWYGMTEAGMGTYTRLDEERRPGSAGRRFPDSTMTILGEDGREAETGEVGEVAFRRGSITFDGYLNDDEATHAAIDEDWFHTGDLGYFDADGYFFFVDRMKDIVRRGGENISSMEIEGVLRTCEGVADAAVVGRPDPVLGERVVAFVVPGESGRPDPEDIKRHVAAHLARFKVPEEFFFLDELPRTPTGKIIKVQLRRGLPVAAGT